MTREPVEATLTVAGGSFSAPLATNLKATYYEIWGEFLDSAYTQGVLSFLQSSG